MRKYFLLVTFLPVISSSSAQEDSTSAFPRPDIKERHLFDPLKSFESELSFTYSEFSGAGGIIPPFVLIGGHITEKTEARFSFNYEPQSNRFVLFDYTNNLTNISFGEMTNLLETNNWMPDIYLVNNLFFPYQKLNSPDIKFLNWESALFMENIINRRFTVNYSLSYVYANFYLKSSSGYSACANYLINPSVSLFAEHFGFFHAHDELFEPGWDGGIKYTFKKSQVDLCYASNYYDGIDLGFLSITYGRNLQYKTTRKR